jgi:hypothetical protein
MQVRPVNGAGWFTVGVTLEGERSTQGQQVLARSACAR